MKLFALIILASKYSSNQIHGILEFLPPVILYAQSAYADSVISLESIAPNPSFMNPVSPDSDEYRFNLSAISAKSASSFTYRVHINQDSLTSQCPIVLRSTWKLQGDKLGMQCAVFIFSRTSQ